MANRIAIGSGVIGAVAIVVLLVLQVQTQQQVKQLSARIMALETMPPKGSALLPDRAQRPAMPDMVNGRHKTQRSVMRKEVAASTGVADGAPSELYELKKDLRSEVAELVEAQQEEAHEKRRAEWESRMRSNLSSSLHDYADDFDVDEEVVGKLESLVNEMMDQRRQLHDEMDQGNLSFYEMRQERRDMSERMNEQLGDMLNEEQLRGFYDAFPMRGPGGRGRGPGGPR